MSSLGSLSEYINYSQKPRPSVEIRLLDEEEVDAGQQDMRKRSLLVYETSDK